MIQRPAALTRIRKALGRAPVTALLGPRQCGKSTLAREIAKDGPSTFFDLESERDIIRLSNPLLTLEPLKGLIIIDEVQRLPSLFETLRVLADRKPRRSRILILGSASPELVKDTSETLAGRVEFVPMGGFTLEEVGPSQINTLLVRGGFPLAFLARSDGDSQAWRENFIQTFLQRDIPQLGITIPSTTMRRFWTMLAHYHGQIWNAADCVRSMGQSDKTMRRYLDILEGSFMVRQLQPWHENLKKRQVKAPKIFIRDSGILNQLLSIPDYHSLTGHPKLGAAWEGFILENLIAAFHPVQPYFWATHNGAEMDLLVERRGRRYGFEIKWKDAPRMTRSIHTALADLGLKKVWVVYPGSDAYALHENVSVLPARSIFTFFRQTAW